VVVERRVFEGVDGLRDVIATSLNGNVIVVGEVDTSVLLRGVVGDAEELTFQTSVGRAGDVLAIAPLAITRAAGRAATAVTTAVRTSVTWLSVSIGIEGPALTVRVPAWITIGGTARTKVVGVGPVTTRAAPGTTIARTGGRSGIHAGSSVHVALAKVRGDVGRPARGSGRASVLRVVDGQVAHLETVGHICGCGLKKRLEMVVGQWACA
jgi:hypothetical protein